MDARLFFRIVATNWLPTISIFCQLAVVFWTDPDNYLSRKPSIDYLANAAFFGATIFTTAFVIATLCLDLLFLLFKQPIIPLTLEVIVVTYLLIYLVHNATSWVLIGWSSFLIGPYLLMQWLRFRKVKQLTATIHSATFK